MPVATLQCPHCAGPLQVDSASAGQQVLCPHCQGPLVVPPEEVLAQMLAAMPPMEPPPPPLSTDAITLACPVCTGPFQVLPSMSGQQLGCPHCGSSITFPPLASLERSPPIYLPSGATGLMPVSGYSPESPANVPTADMADPLPPPIQPPPGTPFQSSELYPPGP